MAEVASLKPIEERKGADWVAPDCEGLNFFQIDKGLKLPQNDPDRQYFVLRDGQRVTD